MKIRKWTERPLEMQSFMRVISSTEMNQFNKVYFEYEIVCRVVLMNYGFWLLLLLV